MTHAAALVLAVCLQDDPYARLKDAWPKLQEAWKATTEFKGSLQKADAKRPGSRELPDEALRVVGQVHGAFEASGLWDPELAADLTALKQVFKARLGGFLAFSGSFAAPTTDEEYRRLQMEYERAIREWQMRRGGGGSAPPKATPVGDLEEGAAELQKLRQRDSADDDLVQDAIAKIRKAMKDLGIMDDETPAWVRQRLTNLVRALALGEAPPEAAKPTADQDRKVAELIDTLEDGDIAGREEAVRELLKVGEAALPQVRRRYRETTNAEVKARLKRVLGLRDPKPVARHVCRRCGITADEAGACQNCGTPLVPQK